MLIDINDKVIEEWWKEEIELGYRDDKPNDDEVKAELKEIFEDYLKDYNA